jgi:hypothetical protein
VTSDRFIEWDFPGPWPYEGQVIARNDPDGLGRVRVTIPGELDESGWVFPIGFPGAGAKQHGAVVAPPLGAEVLVFFVGGDVDQPRYIAGHYGDDEVPIGTVVEAPGGGDNLVWEDDKVRIEIDSRPASCAVRIKDRASDGLGVFVDVDLAARAVGISGALSVRVVSSGTVEIQGGSVTIQGRLVAPSGPPI